jgi:hypothetical protein
MQCLALASLLLDSFFQILSVLLDMQVFCFLHTLRASAPALRSLLTEARSSSRRWGHP